MARAGAALLFHRGRRAGIQEPMVSEEEMRAGSIGELRQHNDTIELLDYRVEWPALFERTAAQIRDALGTRALLLEHVGSTSVPGLAAKPIIDVLLAVAHSSDESAYVPAMEAAGFVLRHREAWYEHRMFKGSDPDANIHVFSEDCPEIARMLLFREWLRSNAADRELYERTKRELAQRTWKYVQNYADAKTEVVEEIIARAKATTAAR
jgi:GrpB-like predicted nucleotidyltransferase (UPF0157 family)